MMTGSSFRPARNTTQPLRLHTPYGPPEYEDGVVAADKDAVEQEHFDGRTTE
ncbi:MAG TPA: hypothetical protein VEA80_17165 [Vitreimonas sp.]|uniref:hypothetical protein n=1 Tax=Vitreimonas sp. TaxID=3069702 RepID=UPI002D72C09F|nr:hypothetical protein [Vitreimonas sp.]HYD89212.1 hypothetical protein [Vitreimonas sp.]